MGSILKIIRLVARTAVINLLHWSVGFINFPVLVVFVERLPIFNLLQKANKGAKLSIFEPRFIQQLSG